MGKLRRCSLALLTCIALGIGAGWQTGIASATDLTDLQADPQQTSSSTASAYAQNDSTTSQSTIQTQVGSGSAGGQSQSIVQTAPTQQSAAASASSTQDATNVGSTAPPLIDEPVPTDPPPSTGEGAPTNGASATDGGSATGATVAPADVSDATAVAGNVNAVTQDAAQTQSGTDSSSGQSQASTQVAATTQETGATAASSEASSAIGGTSPRTITLGSAAGANTNATTEVVTQTQTGSGSSGAESQTAVESAPTVQEAAATASSSLTDVSVPEEESLESPTRSTRWRDAATQPSTHAARASPARSSPATAAARGERRMGGSAGGIHWAAASPASSSRTLDTKPIGDIRVSSAVDALQGFANGSAFVAKILASNLPSSALRRGLDSDGAMTILIAKLLALVYAGFLMVWFWATRLRWSGR